MASSQVIERAAPAAVAGPTGRRRQTGGLLGMRPLTPVAPATRTALGVAFFVLFIAVWAAVTLGGLVPKTFLASPLQMLASGWKLLTEFGFLHDVGMTMWGVVGGFVIAAAIALPLGILMGAYKPVRGLLRTLRQLRALPAGLCLHPAADPVGRHRS